MDSVYGITVRTFLGVNVLFLSILHIPLCDNYNYIEIHVIHNNNKTRNYNIYIYYITTLINIMIILVDLEAIMRILSVGEARESGFESNQQHEFWVALRSLLFVFIPRDGLLEVMGRHCI